MQKVFELDPQTSGIPWQPRGYVSKRKAPEMVNLILNMEKAVNIVTSLLIIISIIAAAMLLPFRQTPLGPNAGCIGK